MFKTVRSLVLVLAALLCMSAYAQPAPPYAVTISGTVVGCNSANGSVNIITVQGTQPSIDIDVPLDPNCGWSVTLSMDSYIGYFQASTPCGGAIQSATAEYTSNAFSTASITMTLDCLGNPPACNACMTSWPANTGGGPNGGGDPIPWTVNVANCSSGGATPYAYNWDFGDGTNSTMANPGTHVYSAPGTYGVCLYLTTADGCTSADCDTVVVAADGTINPVIVPQCEAGFFVMQAYQWVDSASNPNGGGGNPVPNELWVWNLSTAGANEASFVWSFGDGTSSTDEFPTHTYASGNSYELCLTINDNTGCTDTYCETISVDGDGILSGLTGGNGNRNTFTIRVMNALSTTVAEKPIFTEMTTWPNPVNNELNVSLTSAMKGNVRMSITDLSGRMVMNENRALTNGLNRMTVPVNELSAGLYVVKLTNGTSTVSSRFVKVR